VLSLGKDMQEDIVLDSHSRSPIQLLPGCKLAGEYHRSMLLHINLFPFTDLRMLSLLPDTENLSLVPSSA